MIVYEYTIDLLLGLNF